MDVAVRFELSVKKGLGYVSAHKKKIVVLAELFSIKSFDCTAFSINFVLLRGLLEVKN